jgi:DNA-binding NarL/FixJ family response regulator
MLDIQKPPLPAPFTGTQVAQLLHLCEQLHVCSNEEIQAQLQHLGFACPEQLVQSMRLLLHGSQYIQQQRSGPAPPAPAKAATVLSTREQEIMELVTQGYTMPRIGDKLFISPATVNNHCARIREKLGLQGRNALTTFALNSQKRTE